MTMLAHAHALRSMGQEFRAIGAVNSLRRVASNLYSRRPPRAFFFSHPLTETGAPQALLVALREFANRIDPSLIHVVYPRATPGSLRRYEETGATLHHVPRQASSLGLHMRLGVQAGDLIVINTLAVPLSYLSYLESRRSESVGVIWVHETESNQLDSPAAVFASPLIRAGRLALHAPSVGAARILEERFQSSVTVTYPFVAEEIPRRERVSREFDQLHIAFVGAYAGGIKGQLVALVGLAQALHEVPPERQREFRITLFGISPDVPGVYHVSALKEVCDFYFPGRFEIAPPADRTEFLSRYRETNVTVCSSFSESFALFVLEGMKNSNVLIRNYTAGADEQIRDGVNGFLVSGSAVSDYRDAFKRLLDTSEIPADRLARMGNESRSLADEIRAPSFWDAFGGSAHFEGSSC